MCPKCNGVVGPHSDYCLDCGYDTAKFGVVDILVTLFFIVGITYALFNL